MVNTVTGVRSIGRARARQSAPREGVRIGPRDHRGTLPGLDGSTPVSEAKQGVQARQGAGQRSRSPHACDRYRALGLAHRH